MVYLEMVANVKMIKNVFLWFLRCKVLRGGVGMTWSGPVIIFWTLSIVKCNVNVYAMGLFFCNNFFVRFKTNISIIYFEEKLFSG